MTGPTMLPLSSAPAVAMPGSALRGRAERGPGRCNGLGPLLFVSRRVA